MSKKIIILSIMLFLTVKHVLADVISVDASAWTQQQKNMTQAMVVKILWDNAVTYDSISVSLPNIDIVNPSTNVSAIVTNQSIESAYAAWLDDIEVKILEQQTIEQAKIDEINNSELKNITLAEIDTKINAISNLAEAKVFLKKMCRYIKAREQ